jgi:hypothetical protein
VFSAEIGKTRVFKWFAGKLAGNLDLICCKKATESVAQSNTYAV